MHCAEKIVAARYARWFCVSRKGGTGGGGRGHPQGDMHMVAARLSCQSAMVGEVGGVTRRVTCTWWLLGLAVKVPWLGRWVGSPAG